MVRGPNVNSYREPINQITGKLPLYKPNAKGDMLLRVLPQFSNGVEEPWVDFNIGTEDDNAGLGNQHYSISAISVFRDRTMSWLSAVSKDNAEDSDDTKIDSPAKVAADRMKQAAKKADALKKAGHTDINPEFLPNDYGNSWIGVNQLNLVQALVSKLGGQPVKARDGSNFRFCAVDLSSSGYQDLVSKLFTPRMADASGLAKAKSADDSSLGDYCSCAEGNWMIIRKNPSEKTTKYMVVLSAPPADFDGGALNPDFVASVVRPWVGTEDAIYKMPTHQEVIDAMAEVMPAEMLGYCLLDTQFESYLSPRVVEMGRRVQITMSEERQQAAPAPAARQGPQGPQAPQGAPAQRQNPAAAVTRAPAPPVPGRGPVPPAPPAPKSGGVAYRTPVRQPVSKTMEDMGPMPHMGNEPEFHDPAADTETVVELG